MLPRPTSFFASICILYAACSSPDGEGWRSFPGLVGPGNDMESGAGGSAGTIGTGGTGGKGGSGGTTSATCEVTFKSAICNTCMAKCDSKCVNCQNNSDCNALLDCMMACGTNTTCPDNCKKSHLSGDYVLAPYLNSTSGCIATQCASSCGIDTSKCQLTTGSASCDSCLSSSCLGACKACTGSTDCLHLIYCLNDCGSNQTCAQSCWNANPAGQKPLEDLNGTNGCKNTTCAAVCK